jgi:class 3 adenylate cyclase
MDFLEKLIGPKIAGVRVVPLATKIVTLFAIFILVSNLSSNFINLTLNRGELLKLANRLLVKDLKELYSQASNQYDIFEYSRNLEEAIATIESTAIKDLAGQRAFSAAFKPDGTVLFWASHDQRPARFDDDAAMQTLVASIETAGGEGRIRFRMSDRLYFGMFKYNAKWGVFMIRAEEETEFYADTTAIFQRISLLIGLITIVCLLVGIILLNRILRFVTRFAADLMRMQRDQKLDLINLIGAPNDDVTYLGASFNALSSTINNLLAIFRRFVTKDVAQRAYSERSIRLEGTTKELAILFSDIKGFTFMTETLGNDIIDVLNLHYDQAIRYIHEEDGIVGSIIGDALLAVFGTLDGTSNKSIQSLSAAYRIQDVARTLRSIMKAKSENLIKERGLLTPLEQRALRAVLVEVGVGIDGGDVFYGNIGSYERMTNTVIGDNVNSASRLEGLTRIYQVPVICSEYIKDEALKGGTQYRFVELDLVQVKGKLEGKRIYWPVPVELVNPQFEDQLSCFEQGLALYYDGDWSRSRKLLKDCTLPMVEEFMHRMDGTKPDDWNGIWAMKTK